MNAIENRFCQLTKDNEMCDPWAAQWKIAKKRVPQVLDVISHIFPHYSLHNASHSEAILNNIAIILGKDAIDCLSVVDLWFLLNAAYYHDCGMVVDSEDKVNYFAEGSQFLKYVEERQEDVSSPMNVYAKHLEIKDDKLYYANNELTGESYEAVRFLIADFVRKSHADRSAVKIEGSFSESFTGGLIPKRIIGLLSQICAAHMQSREQVMALPMEQTSGCGVESCHPRFIAFLLRIGDLLDVDNNRLSDVLLHSLGSIPVDSRDYNEINRSIKRLNITRKTIEIEADCKNYRIAELTNDWFKWLNDEVVFVTQHWHDIAPEDGFTMLPTIGKLEVNLLGYDTIDGKNRPVFKIDTWKAIEMIQGAGLYSNPSLCMRELLQNAVDATHLRAFKEHPDTKGYKDYFTLLKNYPVKVKITEKKIGEKLECCVEIKDQGIGMSKSDLEYLCNTGSSSKNEEKNALIDKMEDFMRPSGIFGIGFQSVFLISDKVELETKKLNREELYQLEMHNPSGIEKGAILIKTTQDDAIPFGTTLRFKTKRECHGDFSDWAPHDWGFPTSHQYYKTVDFAKAGKDDKYSIFAGLIEEVFKFGEHSSVPIELDYNGKEYAVNNNGALGFFDDEEGIAVDFATSKVNEYYYRGQHITGDGRFQTPILGFKVNILCGKASKWLTLNREAMREDAESELRIKISVAIAKYLESLKSTSSEMQLCNYSLIIDYLKKIIEKREGVKEKVTFDDLWKGVEIPLEWDKKVSKLTIGELLEVPVIKVGKVSLLSWKDYIEIVKDGKNLRFVNHTIARSDGIFDFICKKIGVFFSSVVYDKGICIISKEAQREPIADNEESRYLLLKKYKAVDRFARDYFPCNDKYKALIVMRGYSFYPVSIQVPGMVCPYRRIPNMEAFEDAKGLEWDVDEKVIDFVFEHRENSTTTKEQIREAYEEFRKDYQTAFDKVASDS